MTATQKMTTSASNGLSKHDTPLLLNEDALRALFDQHVANGIILYDSAQRVILEDADGWQIEFRITSAFTKKPYLTTDTNAPSEKPLKLVPGSDINVRGFEIQQLGETHRLTFNMYCTYRPQYLLLTLDGFRRQWEPLDIDDFTAAYSLLTSLNDEYIIFYNCKEEAGCSRLHKHLQAIPKASFDPWENLDKDGKNVPFTFFRKSHGPRLPSPEELHKTYTGFIQEADKLLDSPCTKPNEAPAHNMIMDKRGMIVIPRRCTGIGEVGANACGMLGMIWVSHDYMMEEWMSLGPRKVLTAAGVPRNEAPR